MHGFQLWANLPRHLKMTAPRYQDIKAKPMCPGDRRRRHQGARRHRQLLGARKARSEGVAADPRYLDISVPPGKRKTFKVEVDRHALAYIFAGSGAFVSASKPFGVLTEKQVGGEEIVLREQTGNRSLDWCSIPATKMHCRPAKRACGSCWCPASRSSQSRGTGEPIVMNTQAELNQAVSELRNGTFIKQ